MKLAAVDVLLILIVAVPPVILTALMLCACVSERTTYPGRTRRPRDRRKKVTEGRRETPGKPETNRQYWVLRKTLEARIREDAAALDALQQMHEAALKASLWRK